LTFTERLINNGIPPRDAGEANPPKEQEQMADNGDGNGAGPTPEFTNEDEALAVLMDGDIDKVMAGLDRILEAAPSYEKLFTRWQRQQWSTEDFDFDEDARQWADPDTFTEDERRFIKFGFSEFFLGEERVTTELIPFALATPSMEATAFLTTQISDEAKHVVFWDRFYREVLKEDAPGLDAQINEQRSVVNQEWERLFDGILHECAEDLRKDPSNFGALVRGVTVYMIVIEGTLALTAARFIIKSLKQRGWFPGFVQGFTAVNRDESRHVGFGVKLLADAIKDDRANAKIVESTLKECLPIAPLVFAPPWVENPYDFETPFYHSSEVFEYAMTSLSKTRAAMGLDPAMLAEGAAPA
jgi:ribonucleoside-diphosphate reductase beta chain